MSNYAALTIEDLERVGACVPQRKLFARLAPDGVPLGELEARCVKHADVFNWDWAAYNLLTRASWVEYDIARAAAWDEYDSAMRAAWYEYNSATRRAWDERNRVRAAAFARLYVTERG